MKVALYARLSDDRNGVSTGIDRQVLACRSFAESRGWEIVEEFTDSDLSAFDRNVVRPEYDRMIARLDEFDIVLVWKLDRLVRRFLEFARIWPMFEEHKVALVSATEPIDTSNAIGRIIVLMLVGFAELESENISLRQKAKQAEMRRQGRWHGGRRAFGLHSNGEELIEDEAELVREAVRRVIAGEAIAGIVNDWNRRGITTAGGSRWRASHLRRVLMADRLVGSERMPAILDPQSHRAVKAILLAPERVMPATTRKHLLSGFLYCQCGTRMIVHASRRNPNYYCPSVNGGCGTVSIAMLPLEKLLVDSVLTLIDNSELPVSKPENDDERLLAQIRADEQALMDLARSRFVERVITDSEYGAMRAELAARIEAAKRKLAAGRMIVLPQSGQARAEWEDASLHRRRAIMGALVDRVVVKKATRYGPGLDLNRLELQFRS